MERYPQHDDEADDVQGEANDVDDGADDLDDEASDVDDEASQFMDSLVRDHLTTVMERHQEQLPILAQELDDAQRLFFLQMVPIALEQDKDVMLAYLFRAAQRVGSDAGGADAVAIEDFLRCTVNIIKAVGASEGRAFLQTVLEDLLRINYADGQTPSSGHSSPVKSVPGITIFIADESIEIPFRDILPCFWTTSLDTVCDTCHQQFLAEPPIRTVARHQPRSPTGSGIHVRIINRHLSCLEATSTFFVPVSHVWDSSIRTANESRSHNEEAASTLINALGTLLEAAEDAYESGVEFWHDYFSVPQWETEVKESLLLCLPAIYRRAEEILVQMSDLSPSHATLLILGSALPSEFSLMQALHKVPLLCALSSSQWMQRMWVTLEYSQSRAACVMDQSDHIWRTRQGNGLFSRDTFTKLLDGGQKQLIGLFRYAKTFSQGLSLPGEFLSEVTDRNRGPGQLCLGEAMDLVSRKKCQVFRDRFFAIHVLLNKDISPSDPVLIPELELDACTMVWRNALNKNDYSPLLLQPRESIPSSNPGPHVASFLVGHQSLDGVEWGLSDQKKPPRRPITVTGSLIQFEADFVGEMGNIHYLDVEESGEVAGVDQVISLMLSIANVEGVVLSVQRLVDGLNRVFPFDMMHVNVARVLLNMVISFGDLQERDDGFENKLEEQLSSYRSAPDGELGSYGRRAAAEEISRILQLETHIMADISDQVTRLTRSRHVARRRKKRGSVGGEPLCEVKCPGCHVVTLFRLDLRLTARSGDKVYRIPGLGYSESVEDGVGLVINEGRITGRMYYGPPACGCEIIERIEIQ